MTPTHRAIVTTLRDRGPLTVRQLATALGCSYNAAYSVLRSVAGMEREGRVWRLRQSVAAK